MSEPGAAPRPLHRQQVDVALAGFIKAVAIKAAQGLAIIAEGRPIERAGQVICLYDMHIGMGYWMKRVQLLILSPPCPFR